MSPIVWAVALALFAIGLAAVVMRRELLAMLLGIELMLGAVNVIVVCHAAAFGDAEGLSAALLILAVGAAEAVVGLSLILSLRAAGRAPDANALRELRG